MTFEKYLEELGDVKRPLTTAHLTRLSRLSPEDAYKLASFWPTIPAARKERIARVLLEMAEDDVELDFEDFLRLCLSDPSPAVRVAGIEGLFECTERWFLDQLIRMARSDEAEEVRSAAAGVEALGRFALRAELGDLSARDIDKVDQALFSVLEDEGESLAVRRRAIESLGVRNTARVASAIERAYMSGEQELLIGAIYAMGRNGDEKWLSILLQELTNPDAEVRYEAINACGELEDKRAVPHLIPLLRDSDLQVSLSAVGALGHIGGPRAKEELLRCLQSSDEQIRDAAQDALEEISFYEEPLTFGLGS